MILPLVIVLTLCSVSISLANSTGVVSASETIAYGSSHIELTADFSFTCGEGQCVVIFDPNYDDADVKASHKIADKNSLLCEPAGTLRDGVSVHRMVH